MLINYVKDDIIMCEAFVLKGEHTIEGRKKMVYKMFFNYEGAAKYQEQCKQDGMKVRSFRKLKGNVKCSGQYFVYFVETDRMPKEFSKGDTFLFDEEAESEKFLENNRVGRLLFETDKNYYGGFAGKFGVEIL